MDEFDNKITVFNLVTKPVVMSFPTYQGLKLSLIKMKELMEVQGLKKLAIPMIGCGIDGLEWDTVRAILHSVFIDTDIEILVCKLEDDQENKIIIDSTEYKQSLKGC